MYSTCLFCNNSLGVNESIEQFPVGRRLAFDSATGRLWVVCKSCERWNLSPLETRWEAIEEAERAFRGTKLRVSTDNIGLAQLRDGTELVRIGKPVRAEFAAWRYGDQFGRRWRQYAVGSASVATLPAAQAVVQGGNMINAFFLHSSSIPALITVYTAFGFMAVGGGFRLVRKIRDKKLVAVVRDDDGHQLRVNRMLMDRSIVTAPAADKGWELTLSYPSKYVSEAVWYDQGDPTKKVRWEKFSTTTLKDENALRALATVLPHVNRGGGSKRTVRDAVDAIADAHELSDVLKHASYSSRVGGFRTKNPPPTLVNMNASIRLALEMSVHETDERRALEGELKELEQRWREADAIAKIADEMFLPENVANRVDALRDQEKR